MEGILEVKETKTQASYYLSHYTLLALDTPAKKTELKALYERYRNSEIEVFCVCSSNPISMSANYITDTDSYYLKSFPNQAKKHSKHCYFFSESTLSSNYSSYTTNLEEDSKKNLHVTLYPHDYKNLNNKPSKTALITNSRNNSNSRNINKMSLNQFIKLVVTTAWNDYMHLKGDDAYPSLNIILNQIMSYTAKKIFVTKEHSLNSLLFKGGNTGQIFYKEQNLKGKYYPFTLFPFKSADEWSQPNRVLLYLEDPIREIDMTFSVSKDHWKKANASSKVSSAPYIVGGFIRSVGKGLPPEFISIGILPINNYGIPVESSFERQLFDLLCGQKRLVQRPILTKYYPLWSGLLPDGLLIDTVTPTIIEVFGMSENHRSYHLHRKYKIEHFSSLKSRYNFWYWDAFKNSSIPPIPIRDK